ncbi:focadhesin-like [Littorina saxatilis]|uniref:focadhesin-like n=1 Tax=Littorina saxatilis TaxID=31220 RepID=UPI0038B49811
MKGTCNQALLSRVTQIAVSLLLPAVQHQLNVKGLLDSVLRVVQQYPECLSGQIAVSQLCGVLMELGPFCPPSLLQLVEQVVSVDRQDRPTLTGPGAAILVLPLLQLLSGASPGGARAGPVHTAASRHREMVTSATAALRAVERAVMGKSGDDGVEVPAEVKDMGLKHLFGREVRMESLTHLLSAITSEVNSTCVWLSNLLQQLSEEKSGPRSVSWQTTCAVASVLVVHPNSAVTSLALDVLVQMARLDNTKAPLFLPLLLYCLGRETAPESRLLFLEHMPLMAQHKLCVAPILKTLQALMTSPRLRPLTIRLMTSLWSLQDRCFPQLLKAIGEDQTGAGTKKSSSSLSSSLPFDVLLAKAAAVKEICRLRPEQHGAELLSPLSNILTSATDQQGAAPSALALEGLYHLCEAEVIDIQSAWGVLSKQLSSDKRNVVIVKICELFSLIPSLAVSTPEYEIFQERCVQQLWQYTQSTDPTVQGAAYQALASFPVDAFRVGHLPRQVCEELHSQAEVVRQQQEGSDVTVDTLFNFIPGVCFTRLLQTVPHTALQDYGAFLSSMVGKEVDKLPRGIHHNATRRQGVSTNQDRAIGSIPTFVTQQYDKTKQPGLRPSLAAALLFCFDPPVEVGRDGRPRKHYLVRHGKLYIDTFKTLLNEVPVQPSEWHRSLLMPQAWTSFVDRLCLALIESRKAEVDLQAKHGHISEDQKEEKTLTAWLFARDSIVDTLKVASKGNPSQQANAVLALASLVVFVHRYGNGLDPEEMKECDAATEHLSQSHWLTVAVDTILSIRDVTHRSRGKLLGLGQQRSAEDRTSASSLAQATACVCLATLAPCLTAGHSDVILLVLRELTSCLPGGKKAPDSPVLLFHSGLGLGMLLGRLFEDRFCDVGGRRGQTAVWQSMGALEDCCMDTARENRTGCVLGLGLALTGLCQEGQSESRVHVTAMWGKLGPLLDNTPPGDSAYQALCFCLACVSGAAFTATILKVEHINASLHQLEMAHNKNTQTTGTSLGLGMLCYTLSRMGHPGVAELRQTLTSLWLKAVTTEGTPPMERISSLNGLMALIGSEQSLVVVQSGVSLASSDVKVSEVIEVVTRIVLSDPDLGIQSNAAWMLGHLHMSACAVAENRATVPTNYGYLPEASFLRAIVDLLLEAGQQGPERISEEHVKVALTSLQEEVRRVLPPLNWAGVLSPLMRMNFGEECKRAGLALAVSQSSAAPTAAMFLSSWLTPPLSMTLTDESKRALFKALPTLIKAVPGSILSTFLERSCAQPFQQPPLDQSLATCVLQGLTAAVRVTDPPEAVTALLYTTIGKLYSLMPAEFHPGLYKAMGECLACVPDEIFDSITVEDYMSGKCTLRGFFIGCYLVARGNQPITLLNGLIDSAMNSPQCSSDAMLYMLAHCFWLVVEQRSATDLSGPMARLNWLLELLGHTRNVVTGAVPLTSSEQSLKKAVEFSIMVVAVAMNLLTSVRPSSDFGLDPALLRVMDNEKATSTVKLESLKDKDSIPDWIKELEDTFLHHLPSAVLSFERTPWDQLLPKVYDWLVEMNRLADDALPFDVRRYITASLLMLRHSSEFRKTANWTRFLSTL